MTLLGTYRFSENKIFALLAFALTVCVFSATPVLNTACAHPEHDELPEMVEGRGEFEMVLIHGLGGSNEIWEEIVPFLSGVFKVHLFELSGHGKTQPIMDTSIGKETERLAKFLKEKDIPYPTLVGHGLGGMIALKFTLENPADVHRLILMDTAPKQMAGQDEKQEIARLLATDYDKFVAGRYLQMSPKTEITDKILDIALKTDPNSFTTLLMSSFDFDLTEKLGTQSVPLLVIGSELLFPTPESSRPILNQIGFDKARVLSFKRLGQTGHYMMLERTPYLASVLMAFGVTAEYRFEAGY